MALPAEQLETRAATLGGSEALAYCGKDPRCTPLELYRRKIGESREPQEATSRIEWGRRLEPVVRDWLAERIGRNIVVPPLPLTSARFPFMRATLDGIVEGLPEGVEIKTADKFEADEWGDPGSDLIPVRYVLQVTHYMIVTGFRRFHVGALVGGNDARYHVVEFDEELANLLVARAQAFWRHVETRTPPEVQTLEDAGKRWPRALDKSVVASAEIVIALDEFKRLRDELKQRQKQLETTELLIKTYMGEASAITDARGKTLATWREQGRSGIDIDALSERYPRIAAAIEDRFTKVSRFRVFRVK